MKLQGFLLKIISKIIEINLRLEKSNFTYIDNHPWNYVFQNGNVYLIDFGKFKNFI